MPKDRAFWPEWARILQRWGVSDLAALLLDAAGPLNIILAQAVHAGRPFLGQNIPDERIQALASLFENQEESRSFAAFLREESTR